MPELSHHLQIKQTQELRLTQKQIQSLNILQLQKAELEQLVERELESNPLLEKEEAPEKLQEEESKTGDEEVIEKIDYDWLEEIDKDGYMPSPVYRTDQEDKSFEKFVGSEESLSEYLLRQLHLVADNEHDYKIGEFLIGNLDRNGFLKIALPEAARYLSVPESEVEDVLYLVQELGPTGVGARDIKESLYIQYLEKGMDNELVSTIIQYYLEDLGRNKLRDIARKLRVSIEEVKAAAETIRNEFSPRPAIDDFIHEEFYVPDPDIIVTEDDGKLIAELNEKGIPKLRKSKYYQRLLRSGKKLKKDAEKYLKERIQAAEEFMNSIEKRRETILKIANLILERQEEFFFKGIRYLKSYTIKEVAEKVGVHESTVSRAVNNKYMATPRGMFELRFFFTSGYTSSSGEDTSRESIKDLLREVVESEDKKHPYSDQKLVELLKQRGIVLARRTITKYREELGILSASKRKEY